MKSKYLKFLEKKLEYLSDFKVRKEFLNKTQKHKTLRKELINSARKICASRDHNKLKRQATNGRRHSI